jgi:WD40 repeat protein
VTCGLQSRVGTLNEDNITELCLWDTATGKRRHTLLRRPSDAINRPLREYLAAFSPDGRRLVVAGDDGLLRIFDPAKGVLLRELHGDVGEVLAIQFHPDGRTLMTAGHDGTVRLWDMVGPEDEMHHGVWRRISGLAASPDGRHLLLARRFDSAALLIDRHERRSMTLGGHSSYIDFVDFSGDGTKALTTSGNRVFVWDAATGKLLRELRHEGNNSIFDVAGLSHDGTLAFSQMRGGPAQLWDVTTGRPLRALQTPDGIRGVHTGQFAPDGQRLLTTGRRLVPPLTGGSMSPPGWWDVATGQRLHEFEEDRDNKIGEFLTTSGQTYFATLSPDGRRVLTCSSNGSAQIWNAHTGERGPRLTGHTNGLTWGAFSPDGRLVATASDDATARLWDVETGKELRVFRGHDTVLDRSRETGLMCVHFSPSGKRLLTAGGDGRARVVEVATGKLIRHLPLMGDPQPFAMFLDEDAIVTLVGDVARIWPVDALAEAKRRKPRELTAAERERYEVDGMAP